VPHPNVSSGDPKVPAELCMGILSFTRKPLVLKLPIYPKSYGHGLNGSKLGCLGFSCTAAHKLLPDNTRLLSFGLSLYSLSLGCKINQQRSTHSTN
jgi:hypothetical protein